MMTNAGAGFPPEHSAADIPLSPVEHHLLGVLEGEGEIDLSQEIKELWQEGAENLPASDIIDGDHGLQENPDP